MNSFMPSFYSKSMQLTLHSREPLKPPTAPSLARARSDSGSSKEHYPPTYPQTASNQFAPQIASAMLAAYLAASRFTPSPAPERGSSTVCVAFLHFYFCRGVVLRFWSAFTVLKHAREGLAQPKRHACGKLGLRVHAHSLAPVFLFGI